MPAPIENSPTLSRFAPGDIVECQDASGTTYLAKGRRYTVKKAQNYGVMFHEVDSSFGYWMAARFGLVESADNLHAKTKPPGAKRFKVGNTVRCLDGSGSGDVLVTGRAYTVHDTDACGANILLLEACDKGFWYTDRFELVTPNFKLGDVVECVRSCRHSSTRIELGQRDLVSAIDERGLLLSHNPLPPGNFFLPSAFKVHKPNDIKAGDTVRCVSNSGLHHANRWLEFGKEYKVAAVDDYVRLDGVGGPAFGFATWRFDVVNPLVEVPAVTHPKIAVEWEVDLVVAHGNAAARLQGEHKVYTHKEMPATALRNWSSGLLTDHMAAVVALNELVGPRRA